MMADFGWMFACGLMFLILGIILLSAGLFLGIALGFSVLMCSIWLGGGSILFIIGVVFICCYSKHKRKQGCHGDRVHVTRNQNRESVVVTASDQSVSNAPVAVVGHDPPQSQYPPPYSACQPRAPTVQAFILGHEETTFTDRIYEDDVPPPSYDSVMKNS